MIIHQPELTHQGTEIRISSRIEMKSSGLKLPERLWFIFPEEHIDHLTDRSDAFIVGLLLLAMRLNEDVEVRGQVSPKLAYGLQEYQRIFNIWNPGKFSLVDIHYHQLQSPPEIEDEPKVMTSFSGGVDSFFTLWHHLPTNQPIPNSRITHGLFIHGYDIPLDSVEDYQLANQAYSKLFDRLGLALISAKINIRHFSEFHIDWYYMNPAALMSVPLVMGGWLSQFFVASGSSYLKLPAGGSSPLIAHLLSTERLQIISHGTATKRIDKIRQLGFLPETRSLLRVCRDARKNPGIHNCSRCERCLRTMIVLHIHGNLSEFTSFEKSSLSALDILRWSRFYIPEFQYGSEVSGLAKKNRKYYIIPIIWVVILFCHFRRFLLTILPNFIQRPIKRILKSPGPDPRHRTGNSDTK